MEDQTRLSWISQIIKAEEEKERIVIDREFSTLMEFPRVETARYSACLRDNTLDGCSLLFYTFRRLSPTSTRDKEDKKKRKKRADRLGVGFFETFEGVTALWKPGKTATTAKEEKRRKGGRKIKRLPVEEDWSLHSLIVSKIVKEGFRVIRSSKVGRIKRLWVWFRDDEIIDRVANYVKSWDKPNSRSRLTITYIPSRASLFLR